MVDKKDALINQAAAGFAYLLLLDELKGTDCYRGEIKQRVNLLMPVLEKYLDIDLGKMWGAGDLRSDQSLYKIFDGWKEIFTQVADLKPEYVPAVAEMMRQMIADPEKSIQIFNDHFPE